MTDIEEIVKAFESALSGRDEVIRQMPMIGDSLAKTVLSLTDPSGGYHPDPWTVLRARRNAYAWIQVRGAAFEAEENGRQVSQTP